MQKRIDIKYNIPSIRLFLDIFDLKLEDREDVSIGDSLNIYMKDIEVGKVDFKEDMIFINTDSIYGNINSRSDYPITRAITDPDSIGVFGHMGLYAGWKNIFDFDLKLTNGSIFSGNLLFSTSIDNDFGNNISFSSKLNYKDGEKEYDIGIKLRGIPFSFTEKRGDYIETIEYNAGADGFMTPYIFHTKEDKYSDGKNINTYKEGSSILKSWSDLKNKYIVSRGIQFNDNQIISDFEEFDRMSKEYSNEEILHIFNLMNIIDKSHIERINRLIKEFSIDGESFLKKILIYGYTNYSEDMIYSMFKLDKGNIDLYRTYFEDNNNQKILKKLTSKK